MPKKSPDAASAGLTDIAPGATPRATPSGGAALSWDSALTISRLLTLLLSMTVGLSAQGPGPEMKVVSAAAEALGGSNRILPSRPSGLKATDTRRISWAEEPGYFVAC